MADGANDQALGTQQEVAKDPPAVIADVASHQPGGSQPRADQAGGGGKDPAPAVKELGTDDELPDEDESRITLKTSSLKARLTRAENRRLKEIFGTSDPKEIEKVKKKWADLEAGQEEIRKAKLTAEERLKEELAKSQEQTKRYEKLLRRQQEAQLGEQTGRQVEKIAAKHVDPDLVEEALEAFKAKVRKMSDEEAETLSSDKAIDKWFADYVQRKPKFAKTTEAPQKKPISVGAGERSDRPNPPRSQGEGGGTGGQSWQGKKVKDMSKSEFRAYSKAVHGVNV